MDKIFFIFALSLFFIGVLGGKKPQIGTDEFTVKYKVKG